MSEWVWPYDDPKLGTNGTIKSATVGSHGYRSTSVIHGNHSVYPLIILKHLAWELICWPRLRIRRQESRFKAKPAKEEKTDLNWNQYKHIYIYIRGENWLKLEPIYTYIYMNTYIYILYIYKYIQIYLYIYIYIHHSRGRLIPIKVRWSTPNWPIAARLGEMETPTFAQERFPGPNIPNVEGGFWLRNSIFNGGWVNLKLGLGIKTDLTQWRYDQRRVQLYDTLWANWSYWHLYVCFYRKCIYMYVYI